MLELQPDHIGKGDASSTSDHFMESDGIAYAGLHLLIDLWGAQRLDQVGFIEETLRQAVQVAEAELLHLHLHRFETGGGISGVAVLAESHISVHTWPERGYAAFDIFMCGQTHPEQAAQLIERCFQPEKMSVRTYRRGLISGG